MMNNEQYRRQSIEAVTIDGLWLEFGVAGGQSARHILDAGCTELYGFDTFTGLPEHWYGHHTVGTFTRGGNAPQIPGLTCYKGLIQDTLWPFLLDHEGPCAFVHVDTDLGSAAEFILLTLLEAGRLVDGTIVMFDELAGYPGWQCGEWGAAVSWLFGNFDCVPVAATTLNGVHKAAYRLYGKI